MKASNFNFLVNKYPGIAKLGRDAEQELYRDPNASIIKLRQFGGQIVVKLFEIENLSLPIDEERRKQINRLKLLETNGIIQGKILDIFHDIRKTGNDAVHGLLNTEETAIDLLKKAFNLAVWFMQVYVDWRFTSEQFSHVALYREKDIEAIDEKEIGRAHV